MSHQAFLPPLTERQQSILDFIRREVAERGRPPTAREVCRQFGFASPRGATVHLHALERKGYLQRTPGESRNIQVTRAAAGIPIVGDVAAGHPILAIENIAGSLDLDSAFGRGELFAVRVRGESMLKCGILPGDYVIVRRQTDVRSGTIAVAYLNGEATVKRVLKTRSGYRLHPENDAYDPIDVVFPLSGADDGPAPDFHIAGPVVGVVRTKLA